MKLQVIGVPPKLARLRPNASEERCEESERGKSRLAQPQSPADDMAHQHSKFNLRASSEEGREAPISAYHFHFYRHDFNWQNWPHTTLTRRSLLQAARLQGTYLRYMYLVFGDLSPCARLNYCTLHVTPPFGMADFRTAGVFFPRCMHRNLSASLPTQRFDHGCHSKRWPQP